jgi:uncharacterized membrane protein YeaQ/YmgE (transglycosylase-associated protein family)
MHFLWWIIVGLIAGWATGKIMRGSGFGPFMDIVIGIVGAIIGGWIMRAIGFQGQGGTLYTILVAIGGAVLLTWLYRLVAGIRKEETVDLSENRPDRDNRSDGDKGDSNLRRVA